MSWKISHLVLAILALGISCKEKPEAVQKETVLEGKHLITYDNPMLSSEDPGIVIVDFRKAEEYETAHIPGSIQLYRNHFQDASMPYPGMRLDREKTAASLGMAGISNQHTIIVYDDKGSPDASRFWWLLKLYNFEQVYLLDGGLGLWEKMGKKTSRDVPEIKPTVFLFPDKPDQPMVIEKEELLRHLSSEVPGIILLDARSADEYSGKEMKSGALRAGRIPGSIHIDWAESIDYSGTHTFKPTEELEKIYSKLGAGKEDTIVVYCHSGVRSSHTTFVLTELLGYKHVLNYDGSWVEWSYDDLLPIETDSITLLKK
ncbi:sulfurtransferase [Muriicola marianensis]|uniref:Sulfurtransferase n=1 Tax=Muriicola marianensis TaxID=1324801 RepID=A0ABQ1R6V8_9FLAO|nr:sulfurtransferase [Muriicola marianensis]GGD58395.1 sulfurtransferase [Muriicola marianensis]